MTVNVASQVAVPPAYARGTVHPAVADVVRAVGAAGWRASSVLRAGSPNHSRGIAADFCPVTWHTGGFGPKTALALWRIAKFTHPELPWLALAELDHIHVQLASRDAIGVQYPGGVQMFFDPSTQKRIEVTPMDLSNIPAHLLLPEGPMGDLSDEFGDLDVVAEDGDVEIGDARKSRIVRAAVKTSVKGRVSLAKSNLSPRDAKIAASLAKSRQATQLNWLTFEHLEGAEFINSTLPKGSKLKPYEVSALKVHLTEAPLVEQQPIPMPVVGGVASLDVDAVLSTVFGLAPTDLFHYVGIHLMITASDLNKIEATPMVVTRDQGAGVPSSKLHFRTVKGVAAARLTLLNGGIISGRARYRAPFVAPAPVATGNYTVSVANVPANYTVSATLMIPGPSDVEKLFALL